MKLTLELHPRPSRQIRIADMRLGDIGRDDIGNYFFRTGAFIACLNDPDIISSSSDTGRHVTLLEPGHVITATVVE